MAAHLNADDIIKRIYDIEYVIHWPAIRAAFGAHVSKKIGAGFRFGGVRPEDVWPSGRPNERVSEIFDEPYVTVWRTTRQIQTYVLDDLSGSMDFGAAPSKGERAAYLAASIAYSAYRNHDRFVYIGFSDVIEMVFDGIEYGKNLPWQIADSRLKFCGIRKSAAGLSGALHFLPRQEPALVFVISDFYPQEDFLPHIADAAERHDVVPIVLRDILEERIPKERGYVALMDSESGREVLVPLGTLSALQEENKHLKRAFEKFGLEPVWCLPSGDDLLRLTEYFLRRMADA